MSLLTVSADDAGWTRRRHGRGFSYLDDRGGVLAGHDRDRCRALVIPPAWQEVWICPSADGHLQATGLDSAGRRQYLYHPDWREERDHLKHLRVVDTARRLPEARAQVALDLRARSMTRARVLAVAFRMLDVAFLRVGHESYAAENGSYGLTTLRRSHATARRDGPVVLDFPAKSGVRQHLEILDPEVHRAVTTLKRRRDADDHLLAYRSGGRWHRVDSDDVNDYVREVLGSDTTAKDFRTWNATVLAATSLAVSVGVHDSATERPRAISRTMQEVSHYLGNTPAVARASYVDPRLVELYERGRTIAGALEGLGEGTAPGEPATHGVLEAAVLALLDEVS